jgi:hypothetical protein
VSGESGWLWYTVRALNAGVMTRGAMTINGAAGRAAGPKTQKPPELPNLTWGLQP